MRKGKIVVLGVVCTLVVAGSWFFIHRPTNVINGINIGKMSFDEIHSTLVKAEENRKLTLDNQTFTVGDVASVDFNPDDLQSAVEGARHLTNILKKDKPEFNVKPSFKVNEKSALKIVNKGEGVKQAVNAKIKIKNGRLEITESSDGNVQSYSEIADDFQRLVETGEEFNVKPYREKPTLHSSSSKFKKLKAKAETVAGQEIQLKVSGKTIDSVKALTFAHCKKNKISFSSAKIKAYIEGLARQYDNEGVSYKFKTHAGKKITVPAGTLYWKIDVDTTAKRLTESLTSDGKDVDVSFTNYGSIFGENKIGDNYVEVSIAKQHVWVYKNGKVVLDSACVTGLPTVERQTKKGAHRILYKQRDRILRGSARAWSSFVSYWMPFTWDGQGLHDASWRASFGGNIWKSSGSHGCVNLPKSAAGQIYEVVETNMPVIVY